MKSFLAVMFLASLSFASSGGGDQTVGTLPGQVAEAGSVDDLRLRGFRVTQDAARSIVAPTSDLITVYRHIAGVPGTTISERRGNLLLIAQSEPWNPGTEDLAGPPPEVTTVTWTSGGKQFSVTYTQGPSEPMPDFHRRVDASVRDWERLRPRDAGPNMHQDWNH